MKLITILYLIFASNPALANLTTTARTLTKKTQDLGKIVVGLFIVVVGVYYTMGNERAKDKLIQLSLGAFMILAGRSILIWLQAAVR